jgi:two-component sensor histidine kinase
MSMLKFWISICCIVIVHLAEAQLQPTHVTFEPFFNNYTVEDGLPSNETYHVIQDRNGYIWSAGDQGVTRFDGEKIDVFGASDGMTDESVYKLYEDYRGRIWAVTSNKRLCYFENDSFHPYEFNDSILSNTTDVGIPLNIAVDSSNAVYVSYQCDGMLKIDSAGKVQSVGTRGLINGKKGTRTDRRLAWEYVESTGVLLSYNTATYTAKFGHDQSSTTHYIMYRSSSGARDTMHIFRNEVDYSAVLTSKSVHYGHAISPDSMLAITYNDTWLLITRDTVRFFPERYGITNIQNIDGKVWLSLRNHGAKCYDLKNLDATPTSYLNEMTVTSVEKDWQGGHWFSTLEHGLFYASNLNLSTFTPPSYCSNIGTFHLGQDQSYLLYNNGWLQRIEGDSSTWERLPAQGNNLSSHYDSSTDRLTMYNKDLRVYEAGKLVSLVETPGVMQFAKLCVFPNNDYIIYQPRFISYASSEDTVPYGLDNKIIRVVLVDTVAVIVTTEEYLFKKDTSIDSWDYGNEHWPKHPVFVQEHDGTHYISTASGALFKVEDKTAILVGDNPTKGKAISAIAVHNDTYFLGTQRGIYIFDAKTNSLQRIIGSLSGLPNSSVRDLAIRNDSLWIATKSGLSAIPLNKIQGSSNSILRLKYLTINESAVVLTDTIYSPHNKNRIEILLESISFPRGVAPTIYYQLVGEEPVELSTTSAVVRYSSLRPGTYTFEYRATLDNINFTSPKHITIVILPPFWLTWWFIIIAVLLALGVIYLIIRWRIGVRTRKSAIASQLLELRSSALRAQMNPHFTYNALNSIQSLIASNDTEKAAIYLAEFSQLMRMALEASTKELITVEEEVSIVRHYLLLEKVRFKEKIEYSIEIGPEVDADTIKVPPMIIQPYVENAIIHGLLPKQTPGNVRINIGFKEANQLLIVIEDDGIGLAKSAESNIPGATSKGMEITKSRIQLLDAQNELEIADTEGGGTTIIIKLHVNL